MDSLDIKVEVLTPAFLSGADQAEVELRSASIRGELRFWWRALADGSRQRLARLMSDESLLFGSAEEGLKSPVRVQVRDQQIRVVPRGHAAPVSTVEYTYRKQGQEKTADVLPYLAYGPVRPLSRVEQQQAVASSDSLFLDASRQPKRGSVLIRPALGPGSTFTVRLAWMNGALSDGMVTALVRAAASWVVLGGIGCRSRKGWGALSGVVCAASSQHLKELAEQVWSQQVETVLENGEPLAVADLPLWPVLRHRVVKKSARTFQHWQHALGVVGLAYKSHHPPPSRGGSGRPGAELRWIFGEAEPRRASSLFLTVVREGQEHRGVVALLPCARDECGGGLKEIHRFIDSLASWQL